MIRTRLRPTILVIENAVAVTGSLKSMIRVSSVLRNEFDFLFVLPKHSQAKSFVERAGFVVYEMSFLEISRSWKLLLYIPTLFFNVFILRKIISKSNAKLIVGNDFYNMVPAFNNLLGGRTPYITFVRFIPSRFPKLLVNIWCFFHYRLARKVIAVSDSVYQDLEENPKVVVIHNELPIEEGYMFFPYDLSSKIILYLSNYIPGKGMEYAIQAFSSLGNEFSDWTMRIVGSDMGLRKNKVYKRKLQALSKSLKVSDKVHWCDFTENVVEEYKQAALVLNFSDSESFSLTCIEAMFIGRPVIATKCGGPEEIITPGVDGELVEVRNQKQMVLALRKLLSNAHLRENYGERAHASVSSKFRLEKTTHKLTPIFNEAINTCA
ncbi:MAG: glycosyltransferase [Bacteroidota bacterium]